MFLTRVRRWAEKYSPWVSAIAPNSLVLDVTGCTHLFGGEAGLATQIEQECRSLRLSVRIGLTDTLGAGLGTGPLRQSQRHRTTQWRCH